MHQIEIEYKGNLRTESVHLKSGQKLITDAPVDNKGKGEAFSPTDLTASALGSCMLTIIGITAERRDIDISGVRAEIEKVMGTNPRRITRIIINIYFQIKPTKYEQQLFKKSALSCPVHRICILILKYGLNFITINNTIIVIIVHEFKKPILLGWAFIV